MSISTTDATKKDVLGGLVRVDTNYYNTIVSAYNIANSTSYSNKGDVLSALQDTLDSIEAARTAVDNLV